MPRRDQRPRRCLAASSSGAPAAGDEPGRRALTTNSTGSPLASVAFPAAGLPSAGAVAAKTAVTSSGGYSPLRRSTVTWPAAVRPSPLTTSAHAAPSLSRPSALIRSRRCRGARGFGTDLGLDGGPHLGERLLARFVMRGDPQHDHAVVAEADRLAVLPVDQHVVCEGRVDDLALGAERPAARCA